MLNKILADLKLRAEALADAHELMTPLEGGEQSRILYDLADALRNRPDDVDGPTACEIADILEILSE